jgi:hypothetical protein
MTYRYYFRDEPVLFKGLDPRTFEPIIKTKLFKYTFHDGLVLNDQLLNILNDSCENGWRTGVEKDSHFIEFDNEQDLLMFTMKK